MGVLETCFARIASLELRQPEGLVSGVTGLLIESQGPPVPVGSQVDVSGASPFDSFRAEVVGFRGGRLLLMPYEAGRDVRLGNRVRLSAAPAPLPDPGWIGRVVDGLGRPLDGGPPLRRAAGGGRRHAPMNPLRRRPASRALVTGIRAIDGLLTCAQGQRVGIFGGSGVGKSTLLAQMARGSSADVSVIALIGERGREVAEFVEQELGAEGLARAVVVASTSDAAALLRLRAAETALAAAEAFRDQGRNVLLIFDSLTRVAMAQREVGLASGEPPTARGYTPSVFALLPRLVERAGSFERGSITAFFTVLVEGDDMNEPIADAARSLLDGHIVLDRAMASRGHFPAIDVGASLSRLMPAIAAADHRALADRLRRLVAVHRRAEDLIAVGAYVKGSDREIDEAVAVMPAIEDLLRQPSGLSASFDHTLRGLAAALATPGGRP